MYDRGEIDMTFSLGEKVRYVKAHPSHNQKLKRFAGEFGVIMSMNEKEACVDFSDGQYSIDRVFWIKFS
jgi:hypothetical protein